jgi:hypothetical protein
MPFQCIQHGDAALLSGATGTTQKKRVVCENGKPRVMLVLFSGLVAWGGLARQGRQCRQGSSYINKWLGTLYILFGVSIKEGLWMGTVSGWYLVCYGMVWYGRVRYLGFTILEWFSYAGAGAGAGLEGGKHCSAGFLTFGLHHRMGFVAAYYMGVR